jgi:hypothetical protein
MTSEEGNEIRLIAESIISCIDSKQYDNAKILAESIIAECIVKTEMKDIRIEDISVNPRFSVTVGKENNMGDRANIIVKSSEKEGAEQVCLYTHWAGSTLPGTLKTALIRGKERWDDFQYLTRIIFCEMIKHSGESLDGLTGYGITQKLWDGEDSLIFVAVDEQQITIGEKKYSFEGYIASDEAWG